MPTTNPSKFTIANVRKILAEGQPGRNIREGASPLILRTTARGGSWAVMRKIDGRMKTFSMTGPDGAAIKNSATVIPVEQARKWALGVVGALAKGHTPSPEKRPQVPTFAELAEEHLAAYPTAPTRKTKQPPRPASVVAQTYGVRHAVAHLGTKLVTEVTADDIETMGEALSSSPASATKAYIATVKVMQLAVIRGYISANPARAAAAPARPEARETYPSLPEIGAIWRAAEADGTVGATIVRFVFATGLRVAAAAGLEWCEVDMDNAELRLAPKAGRKFKQTVRLPLGAQALAILKAQPRRADTALVFPGADRHGAPTAFRSWDWIYRRLRTASGVDGWSGHDARRAIVSITADEDDTVDVMSLDKLLQHSGSSTMGSVGATYQRATMLRRMRRAIDAWDRLLADAIGAEVVKLPEVA